MKFSFRILILILALTIQCFAHSIEDRKEMEPNGKVFKCKAKGDWCLPLNHECCSGEGRCWGVCT